MSRAAARCTASAGSPPLPSCHRQAQAFAKTWSSKGPGIVSHLREKAFFGKRVSATASLQPHRAFPTSARDAFNLVMLSTPPPFPPPPFSQLESSNWEVDVRLGDGAHAKVATPSALLDLHVVDGKEVSHGLTFHAQSLFTRTRALTRLHTPRTPPSPVRAPDAGV